MYCKNCGIENEEYAAYCLNCGSKLEAIPPQNNYTAAVPAKVTPPDQISNFNTQQSPSDNLNRPNNNVPVFPIPQSKPISEYPNYGTQYPQPVYDQYPGYEQKQPLNIWGPFAGYGNQNSHKGWLMDNKGDRTQELLEKIRTNFNDRMIPGAGTEERQLTAKGILVETRSYFMLFWKNITVGLHITQFGKDLYVSIASYLKPPISTIRVLIVIVMLLFGAFTALLLPNILLSQISSMGMGLLGGGGGSAGLATLLCVIGPLGSINSLLLLILIMFSGYKFLTEKDFFAALRTKPNEFDIDDLMAMEKTVEQTVRISMDEIGLDPDDLKPVSSGDKTRLI